MPFVYIVQCADKTYYTGWTVDIKQRIKEHNSGKGAKYTRARLPVRLVYQEKINEKSAALKREMEIKRLSRVQKAQLIKSKSV
ncbi:MAG: GIY-YIG nuclease family protein [Firmicutes bacterium]|nr:GIY-YIG nuclease family protein [Bacillota bacterium]